MKIKRLLIKVVPQIALLTLLGSLAVPRALGVAASNAESENSAAAADQYQKILKDFQTAQQKFMTAYQAASTDAERQKLTYPNSADYARRMLEVAEKNPASPAAVDALVWVAVNDYYGPNGAKALKELQQNHIESEQLGPVCQRVVYSSSDETEKFLRAVLEKNPHKNVQAQACMALARFLRSKNPPEAERLFNRVSEQYGDTPAYRGTLADAAKAELYEMHNLVVGKVAPEIEGEDVDGKTFKLSDYRGKVVVLDFWGDW